MFFSDMSRQPPLFLSTADQEAVEICYAPFKSLFDSKVNTVSAVRLFCAARDGLDFHELPQTIHSRLSYLLWNANSSLPVAPEEPNCNPYSFHEQSPEQIQLEISSDLDNMTSSLQDEDLAMEFVNTMTCLASANLQEPKRLLAEVYRDWLNGFLDISNRIEGIF